MAKIYKKDVIRNMSLFDVRAWHEGESVEFKKWTGFGFYNTLFASKNNLVAVYYDKEETDKFDKVLGEKLDDNLCDNFFELTEEAEDAQSNEDIYKLSVRCLPALIIFDEISKYLKWATPSMLRRLIRVRTTTQDFHHNLSEKADHSNLPADYLFFKGELLQKLFEELINEHEIVIEQAPVEPNPNL